MLAFLQRQWFLVALVTLIAAGTTLGANGFGPRFEPWLGLLNPRLVTAGILFLMSFSLETSKLWSAMKSPVPVLLGFLVNFGLIPLLAWPLVAVQRMDDFRFGLMIAASVPSTLAAAAVITRKAGGNDAVSLLITMATNLTCFAVTPLWLKLTTGTVVPLKTEALMFDLVLTVLAPTVLGQGLRLAGQLFSALRPMHEFATYRKSQIGMAAQILIVSVVFSVALRAGIALRDHATHAPSLFAIAVVWLCCIGVHAVALFCGLWSGSAIGLPTDVCDAVGFAGSQKTLPVGVYIASLSVFQPYPFTMLPMLLFHASQLFLDTVIASHLARRTLRVAPKGS